LQWRSAAVERELSSALGRTTPGGSVQLRVELSIIDACSCKLASETEMGCG